MENADLHVSLVLNTRLPGGLMDEDLLGAARAAAEAAADELAGAEYGGRSASVDFSVSFGVRTVPGSTPIDRRFVVLSGLEEDETETNDSGDEGVPNLDGSEEEGTGPTEIAGSGEFEGTVGPELAGNDE